MFRLSRLYFHYKCQYRLADKVNYRVDAQMIKALGISTKNLKQSNF